MPDMNAEELVTTAYLQRGSIVKSSNTVKLAAGLLALQNMMASWSAEGLIVPYYTTESFTLTIGQAIYTIGNSGSPDFSTARPTKIVRAWIRQSGHDYPVDVDMTEKGYGKIVSKDTTQRPTSLYYDPQYPLAKIRFNSESDKAHTFFLVSEKPLAELANLSATLSLPTEINEAVIFNLAIRLAPASAIKLRPQVFAIAQSSKETLENINSLNKLSKPVEIDNAITYNIIR